MRQFKIVGDLTSSPFHSSRVIIDNTNKAAKELGLYDENGLTVIYDTLCNSHGYSPDAFWCAYELPIPKVILHQAGGKPILGLSRENAFMFSAGGYPHALCNYVELGCDTSVWTPQVIDNDKFTVGCSIESTVRSDIPVIIAAFGRCFGNNRDVRLHIKDRNATETFKAYVSNCAKFYNVEILHQNEHLEDFEQEKRLFASWDVHCYLNRAGTFCLTALQGMACGIPTVSAKYSGPSDYLSHRENGMAIEYDIVPITQRKLNELTEIGMRSYLFPLGDSYINQPYWAEFRIDSLESAFSELYENKALRDKLSINGIMTANWFNWRRTATNMSFVLSEFYPV